MKLSEKNKIIQRHVSVPEDGVWGNQSADAVIEKFDIAPKKPSPFNGEITLRTMQELVGHEAIVQEMYFDSVKIATWSVGITSASGHSVERYKDNPQSLEKCLSVFVWLVKEKYAPAVRKAFAGRDLTEEQFAAALSFHYNTGAIKKASWVKSFMAGRPTQARKEFMNWRKPAEIIPRRQAECDLFFDGVWTASGKAQVIPVRKPSYQPDFRRSKMVDITADLERALA